MERKSCHRCGRATLTGLSNGGRCAAVDVRLDVTELDPVGELSALHEGRRTWTLHATGDAFMRDTAEIGKWPAVRSWRRTVHADHRCAKGEV